VKLNTTAPTFRIRGRAKRDQGDNCKHKLLLVKIWLLQWKGSGPGYLFLSGLTALSHPVWLNQFILRVVFYA